MHSGIKVVLQMLFHLHCCLASTQKWLGLTEGSRNSSRLAISLLIATPRANDSEFVLLKTSLSLLTRNLNLNTPVDIFVFTLNEHVQKIKACVSKLMMANTNLMVMEIPYLHWVVPDHVSNKSIWRLETRFSWGYRMMGEWRLTHQMR